MYKPEEKWDNVLTKGPPVRALFFGINAYENHPILDNCENDADAIAERVRALSDGGNGKCFAKVVVVCMGMLHACGFHRVVTDFVQRRVLRMVVF